METTTLNQTLATIEESKSRPTRSYTKPLLESILLFAFCLFTYAWLKEVIFAIAITAIVAMLYKCYYIVREIFSIDLNFDSSDVELNKIIDDLWD